MQALQERRRILLDALEEISKEYWRLKEMQMTTPELRQHQRKVERARKALQHDCETVSQQLDGLNKWRWDHEVLNAGTPTPAGTSKSASKEGSSERDYPSGLKADQLPLPDTEG